MLPLQSGIVARTVAEVVRDVSEAAPAIIAGVIFLAVGVVFVRVVLWIFRRILVDFAPGLEPVTRRFVVTILAIFLWFGVLLGFLSVVGFPSIAASLGTATGFVTLGVAYALSNMIADAVAGVYLLRDPDFLPGDTVTVGDVTGTVRSIELRKTRLEVDGDVVVLANADIEKRWRKIASSDGDSSDGDSPNSL